MKIVYGETGKLEACLEALCRASGFALPGVDYTRKDLDRLADARNLLSQKLADAEHARVRSADRLFVHSGDPGGTP